MTPAIADRLGFDRPEGVLIALVKSGSPADEAGLREGDVILEIDREPIRNLDDYGKAIVEIKRDKGVLFLVRRGETTLFFALKNSG